MCLDSQAARDGGILRGNAIVKHLPGVIMGRDSFIPVATNARSRNDLVERGFSRQPLRVDVDDSAHAGSVIPCSLVDSKGQVLRWGR